MTSIIIKRKKDFMIIFRPLKVYVNNHFVDYIEPDEKNKEIQIDDNQAKIQVKVGGCSSNIYTLKIPENNASGKRVLRISSQIHNGLFVLIFSSFIFGTLLKIVEVIGPYMYLALISPLSIIVGWQIFGRKNYLRLSEYLE